MVLKFAAVSFALLLPLTALSSSCKDDDDNAGKAGSGGTGGSPGTGGTGTGGTGTGGIGTGGTGTGGGGAGGQPDGGAQPNADASVDGAIADSKMNFFVSSEKSTTAKLGGLTGADARCQALAAAVGFGAKTWHAYLSVEHGSADGGAVNARDRIGSGPWYNAKGALVANDLNALHARTGDADVFLNEHGDKIPGQWPGSPKPVEHDILTGSNAEGRVLDGLTCSGWTSDSADAAAQVGHSDGLGPDASANPPFTSWNSSHTNGGCNDTAPRGGAGRIYCFAVN
jgi:hypothetical protein